MVQVDNTTADSLSVLPNDTVFLIKAARSRSIELVNALQTPQNISIQFTENRTILSPTLKIGAGLNVTVNVQNGVNVSAWAVDASDSEKLELAVGQSGKIGNIQTSRQGENSISLSSDAVAGSVQSGSGTTTITMDTTAKLGTLTMGSGALYLSGGRISNIVGIAGDDIISLSNVVIDAPTLVSGIAAGAGNDTLRLLGANRIASSTNLNLGAGNDRFIIGDNASLTTTTLNSSITLGDGDDLFELGQSAQISKVSLSTDAGADNIVLLSGASFEGSISAGSGADHIRLDSGAKIIGNLDSGADNDEIIFKDGSTLQGSLFAGTGNDIVTIGKSVVITGDIDLGSGADSLQIGDFTQIYGDIKSAGSSGATLQIGDGVALHEGEISLGDGNDILNVGHNVFIKEAIKLGGGNHFVSIGNNATLSGSGFVAIDNSGTSGDDTIKIGNDATIKGGILLGYGDNRLTIGDRAKLTETGSGIVTFSGSDIIRIGINAELSGSFFLGAGQDALYIAKDFTIQRSGVVFDGGLGNDELYLEMTPTLRAVLIAHNWVETNGVWSGGSDFYYQPVGSTYAAYFKSFEKVAQNPYCFAKGTQILTSEGERSIESLEVGDFVQTLDHGAQPIRKILHNAFDSAYLQKNPHHLPIKISTGALGHGLPKRDLVVSAQHRIVVTSAIAERLANVSQVLVPAVKLLSLQGVERLEADRVDYYHLVFDRHEVIWAERLETEAFYPGEYLLSVADTQLRNELMEIFPNVLSDCRPPAPARQILKGKVANELVRRHVKNGKPLVGGGEKLRMTCMDAH